MSKKRSWKFWVSRTLLLLLTLAIIWTVNLIWFKPFNIRHFYDRIFVEVALQSPELITSMGIPFLYDRTKDQLDDISEEKAREQIEWTKKNYEMLKSYDFDKQSPDNQLNTKILSWYIEKQLEGEEYFYYGYPVNQLFGIQSGLPSFMANSHKLRNKSDVEAYIKRLTLFEKKFDQLMTNLEVKEEKGIIPPKFVIKRVLDEMNGFVGNGDESSARENILFTNYFDKTDTLNIFSEEEKITYEGQVLSAIQNSVFPSYQKLIDYFSTLYDKATTDDGVWKLPNGDAFYSYMLSQSTTTDLTPAEVHQIGLDEVARIKKEMWAILINEGYNDTTKTLGEIIQAISQEERFLFSEDDNGRQEVLAEYQKILDEISAGLDNAFDIRPKAGMEVKRVPKFKEETSPKAYYNRPAMDGSRGGAFFTRIFAMSMNIQALP